MGALDEAIAHHHDAGDAPGGDQAAGVGDGHAEGEAPAFDAGARKADVSGPRFLLIRTDAANKVIELAGEANNQAAVPLAIDLAPFADLAVSNVTATPTTEHNLRGGRS